MLAMTANFFKQLGVIDSLELQINTLGLPEERAAYRAALVTYFKAHESLLDEDSQRRLLSNPLRILDSKNPALAEVIENAPKMLDFLGAESAQYFHQLKEMLDTLNIPYRVVPTLVRGLDYYTHLVFEWVTTELGSQGTVCAGGRYDRLVEAFGGQSTPAVGFGLGLERLVLLLEATHQLQAPKVTDIYVVVLNEGVFKDALLLTETLREKHPQWSILLNCQGGGAKNQFKRADKSGALFALVLGESEISTETVVVKFLRDETQQQITLNQRELESWLMKHLGK
jgi:histidyl-tRNA synthetase